MGVFNGVHDLPLPLVIVVVVLLSEGAFVGAELHFGAERGEEGDENDVGEKRVEDALREGGGAVLGRGHEVARDPVLGAVLFDEWVLGVRGNLSRLMEGGRGSGVIGIGGETGIGERGPVGVEEGVVEGSREVGDVDVDCGRGEWRERRVEGGCCCGGGEDEEEEEGEGENGEEGAEEEELGDV